ncbi:RulB [Pseudomonas syringae pv. delphinii]|nr:RulB [Pseudomonas syringae pv. delphinii]RMP23624.1 RulB [Pseudomonas syringae pv. delphinii]
MLVELPCPIDDVRLITRAAVDAVDRIYLPGFKGCNAEVIEWKP